MSVVAGWCNGSTLTLIPVLLMDIVELSEYGVCYGVSSFAVGVLGFLRPSMIGHYRDKLGDYEGLFFLLAQCTLVLAFFWMCASAYDRCLANRHKKAVRCTQGYFWRLGKLESMGNSDINPT
uniref:Putative monocarboxylate transporter n=1 Tax=Ixodes ricinus TaxID=34613 RepID=V5GF66_IXORI